MRKVIYYLMPMSLLKARQRKLNELQRSMVRHPAGIARSSFYQVSLDLQLVTEVIEYAENHKWTAQEVKDLTKRFAIMFLIFLVIGLLGGLEIV